MHYALINFLKNNIDSINKIRQKYDPTYKLINPHMTIMFPIPASAVKEKIIEHIENNLKNHRQIEIRFGKLEKSWDHWLFLSLREGEQSIKKLYTEINSDFLSEYRRGDIEFIPHIGLGLFLKNKSQYNPKNPKKLEFDEVTYRQALAEAESMDLNFKCTVNNLDLVELNDDFTEIKLVKKFILR